MELDKIVNQIENGKCSVCGNALDGDIVICDSCLTPTHKECREYGGGCPIYACKESPKPLAETLESTNPEQQLTVYRSYWDRVKNILTKPISEISISDIFGDEESDAKDEDSLIEWNGLLWEPKCFNGREWVYYNQSDARLKKQGLRHPYPWESGELLCAGLENKLKGPIKKIYDDYFGEWENVGMILQGKEIVVYLDPIFDYGSNGYFLKSHGKILRIPAENAKVGSNKIIDLGDEVSKAFYGRTIKELPEKIKQFGEIYLLNNNVWPAGRVYYYYVGRYYVYSCYYVSWASRGVRPIVGKKISSGNKG